MVIVTCARTVLEKPYEFHDGLTLPVGSRIGFPALAIQTDPKNFPDPLKFDGFRSARVGKSDDKVDEDVQKSAAAHPTTTNLA